MNDLVSVAVEAHGGLKRWSSVTTVAAAASITGKTCKVKGTPDCSAVLLFARVMGEQYAGAPLAKYYVSNPENVPEAPSEGDSHDVCTAPPCH
jgi:hypothetical protein